MLGERNLNMFHYGASAACAYIHVVEAVKPPQVGAVSLQSRENTLTGSIRGLGLVWNLKQVPLRVGESVFWVAGAS